MRCHVSKNKHGALNDELLQYPLRSGNLFANPSKSRAEYKRGRIAKKRVQSRAIGSRTRSSILSGSSYIRIAARLMNGTRRESYRCSLPLGNSISGVEALGDAAVMITTVTAAETRARLTPGALLYSATGRYDTCEVHDRLPNPQRCFPRRKYRSRAETKWTKWYTTVM